MSLDLCPVPSLQLQTMHGGVKITIDSQERFQRVLAEHNASASEVLKIFVVEAVPHHHGLPTAWGLPTPAPAPAPGGGTIFGKAAPAGAWGPHAPAGVPAGVPAGAWGEHAQKLPLKEAVRSVSLLSIGSWACHFISQAPAPCPCLVPLPPRRSSSWDLRASASTS